MGAEDYEKEGRKFYRLAAEHPSAKELDLSDVFWTLHEDFPKPRLWIVSARSATLPDRKTITIWKSAVANSPKNDHLMAQMPR
jgi:hypothetical protein